MRGRRVLVFAQVGGDKPSEKASFRSTLTSDLPFTSLYPNRQDFSVGDTNIRLVWIDPTGTALIGGVYLPTPERFYVDILESLSPWSPDELASWEWAREFGLFLGADPDWRPGGLGWRPSSEGLQRFMNEWEALRYLVEKMNSWGQYEAECLAQHLVEDVQEMTMEKAAWVRFDRQQPLADDLGEINPWTGESGIGPQSQDYKYVTVPTTVCFDMWALCYLEIADDLRNATPPGRCPDCGRLLPFVPRRHRGRLCEDCRRDRNRERWRRSKRRQR